MSNTTKLTTKKEPKEPKTIKKTKKTNNSDETKDLPIINTVIEKKELVVETNENENIDLSEENVELENIDHESDKTMSIEETTNKILSNLEALNALFDDTNKHLKNFEFDDSSIIQMKKITKTLLKNQSDLSLKLNESLFVELAKQVKSNKNNKKNKKDKDPNKDTSKSAVNIKKNVEPEILKIMGLPEDTLLCSTDILRYINKIIGEYKDKEHEKYDPFIFTYDIDGKKDGKKFKIIKDIKIFYDFISMKMCKFKDKKGDFFKIEDFPQELSYQQIMTYNKYCFA
jgi:hypothetical protein